MGTWGLGVFENDTACDFASVVADGGGVAALVEALDRVVSAGDDYLKASDSEEGLAAAEIFWSSAARPGLGVTQMICSKLSAVLLIVISIIVASTGVASAQIVALGHSAVRGHVAEDEMWPAVLEGMLRARGSRVRVINAGVNGETTGEELARVDSAVPEGTRIVILAINGANDARRNIAGAAEAPANIAAIKRKITARGIRIVDAMGLYITVLRQPGMALPDQRHLNVEGCKKLATILAGMVR